MIVDLHLTFIFRKDFELFCPYLDEGYHHVDFFDADAMKVFHATYISMTFSMGDVFCSLSIRPSCAMRTLSPTLAPKV